jgi:transcriptional regulator with XRE-family HTH domain
VAAPLSSPVLDALGRAIRARRLERGYSQERLAEEAGIHPRYLSDVERGRRNIGMVNVDRLAAALSVDLATLMAEVERERRA